MTVDTIYFGVGNFYYVRKGVCVYCYFSPKVKLSSAVYWIAP